MVQLSLLSDKEISEVSDLARRAGELALHMREGVEVKEKTGPHDLVTAADWELSRLITGELAARCPDDAVVSEEDTHHDARCGPERLGSTARAWLIDPIDGTDNYVRNDGQYSVMIGILEKGKPVFGWVYAPARKTLYLGGPGFGAWKQLDGEAPERYGAPQPLYPGQEKRIMMGFRDRKTHPWVMEMSDVRLVKSGSVGLKVAKILDDEADMFVHLSGKLKVWDTAGPLAIALGAGLEAGQLEADGIPFELPRLQQECSVIIGRPGSLAWSRAHLQKG
ncbi:MAG TPA: inositol monophosphatase family protein [Candidatus Obscuribacterales bacterium]